MTPTSALGFAERKRELMIKRNYAYERYCEADALAQTQVKIMSYCDNELLCLEFDLQKFNAEQNMQASDHTWLDKEGAERKWF